MGWRGSSIQHLSSFPGDNPVQSGATRGRASEQKSHRRADVRGGMSVGLFVVVMAEESKHAATCGKF